MAKSRPDSIAYSMRQAALQGITDDDTKRSYKKSCNDFSSYAKNVEGCRYLQDVTPGVIQRYEKTLEEKGYAASTIHTKLAPVCKAAGVDMADISKPTRHAADVTKGRVPDKLERSDRDANNPKFARLVNFQKVVGIRRSELAALTGNCLKRDESGNLCVVVRQGKGGKYQMQRILPEDEKIVIKTFNGIGASDKVFSPQEMQNHINLHNMRSDVAKRAYEYYKSMPEDKLRKELQARYMAYHKNADKTIDEWSKNLYGEYKLRGSLREYAVSKGLPTTYSRLLIMAISVLNLSHWRLDVTVANYLVK